jgi:hypothetical protein
MRDIISLNDLFDVYFVSFRGGNNEQEQQNNHKSNLFNVINKWYQACAEHLYDSKNPSTKEILLGKDKEEVEKKLSDIKKTVRFKMTQLKTLLIQFSDDKFTIGKMITNINSLDVFNTGKFVGGAAVEKPTTSSSSTTDFKTNIKLQGFRVINKEMSDFTKNAIRIYDFIHPPNIAVVQKHYISVLNLLRAIDETATSVSIHIDFVENILLSECVNSSYNAAVMYDNYVKRLLSTITN